MCFHRSAFLTYHFAIIFDGPHQGKIPYNTFPETAEVLFFGLQLFDLKNTSNIIIHGIGIQCLCFELQRYIIKLQCQDSAGYLRIKDMICSSCLIDSGRESKILIKIIFLAHKRLHRRAITFSLIQLNMFLSVQLKYSCANFPYRHSSVEHNFTISALLTCTRSAPFIDFQSHAFIRLHLIQNGPAWFILPAACYNHPASWERSCRFGQISIIDFKFSITSPIRRFLGAYVFFLFPGTERSLCLQFIP